MNVIQVAKLGLLVLLVALAGCGERREVAPQVTKAQEQRPLVVAIPTYPGFAIPYLAKELGYFGNLKVELKRIDDAAIINSGMLRGDIDACFTSVDASVLVASQRIDTVGILVSDESTGADGILVKSGINKISDLVGKKVAANIGWPGHFFLLYTLQKAGIPFDRVPITNMDAEQGGAAFVSGKLDAAVTWEPWLSQATATKAGKVLVSTSTMPGVIVDVMLVRKGTVVERATDIQSFVDAYYRALAAYESDRTKSIEVMAKSMGVGASEFEAMTKGFRFIRREEASRLLAPGGEVDKLFSAASGIWSEAKVIEQRVPEEGRFTDRFVKVNGGK